MAGCTAGAAGHSLHVAVSTMRAYLDPSTTSYLLYEGGVYLLNPSATIEDDGGGFQRLVATASQHWHAGDVGGARERYSAAVAAYDGDYFVDDSAEPGATASANDCWSIIFARSTISAASISPSRISRARSTATSGCWLAIPPGRRILPDHPLPRAARPPWRRTATI